MALLDRSLAKLTLEAFKDRNGKVKIGSLVAMYNPESVKFDYTAMYRDVASLNQHNQVSEYDQVVPPGLTLTLEFDGRGPGEKRPVDEQLTQLRKLCFTVGEKGEPPYLRVSWGKLSWHGHGFFGGRCKSLGMSYTLFDRDAKPLRASAVLTLVGMNSDDMESMRKGAPVKQTIVKASAKDTLPLLAATAGAAVAVAAIDYLKVAQANDLDNLRNLKPGQPLVVGG